MEGLGFPTKGGAEPALQLCFLAWGVAAATPRPNVALPLVKGFKSKMNLF